MKKIIIIILSITLLASCTKIQASTKPETKEPVTQKEEGVQTKSVDKDLYFKEGIQKVDPSVEAPDFTLKNLEGKEVSLSDYKGKVVFLNFWAHWCGPCKEEMPAINNLYNKTKNMDIEIIEVNLGETIDIVSPYIKENSFGFNVLLDSDHQVGNTYGIRSIPTTYIIDKNGFIVAGKLGSHEWDSDNVVEILQTLAKQ